MGIYGEVPGERAFACGLLNSGTNAGAMISFSVVLLAERYSWPWAFFTVGGLGLIWLLFWACWYAAPARYITMLVPAAVTAAAGIAVIGAFVCYAGMGHKGMEAGPAQTRSAAGVRPESS